MWLGSRLIHSRHRIIISLSLYRCRSRRNNYKSCSRRRKEAEELPRRNYMRISHLTRGARRSWRQQKSRQLHSDLNVLTLPKTAPILTSKLVSTASRKWCICVKTATNNTLCTTEWQTPLRTTLPTSSTPGDNSSTMPRPSPRLKSRRTLSSTKTSFSTSSEAPIRNQTSMLLACKSFSTISPNVCRLKLMRSKSIARRTI